LITEREEYCNRMCTNTHH